ncbi:MAG: pectate lyase, partial [Actinomycetota bacterium]|nr:pectate lyase [Actinomycetota bacterium]
AATFKGSSSSTKVVVSGGGAKKASDKVFQHNGGGSVTIREVLDLRHHLHMTASSGDRPGREARSETRRQGPDRPWSDR